MTQIERQPFIISITVAKNEEDIIESFVRHNAKYLDLMFIIDNNSIDKTKHIARQLQRENYPIVIGDNFEAAHDHEGKMTRFTRDILQTTFPDYVCLLDADEFLHVPSRAEFELILRQIPTPGIGKIYWQTHVLPKVRPPTLHPLKHMQNRLKKESRATFKSFISAKNIDIGKLYVRQGNHKVVYTDDSPLRNIVLRKVALAHFPVRGDQQILSKIMLGRIAYAALEQKRPREGQGAHKHRMYKSYIQRETFGWEDAVEASLNYAQDPNQWQSISVYDDITMPDPVPCEFDLAYTPQKTRVALAQVALSWEQSLRRHDSLAKEVLARIGGEAARTDRLNFRSGLASGSNATEVSNEAYGDLPPFQNLLQRYLPGSVLGLGCGHGLYLVAAKAISAKRVLGLDNLEAQQVILSNGEYRQWDLCRPIDLKEKFQLVVCLDVVDQLPPEAEEVVLETIISHATDRILFSAGKQGTLGENCRPLAYWLDRWASKGWVPDLVDTLGFRCLATFGGFKHNPLVLVRDANGATSSVKLEEIASVPWRSWGQRVGIVEEPFLEPIPSGAGPQGWPLS